MWHRVWLFLEYLAPKLVAPLTLVDAATNWTSRAAVFFLSGIFRKLWHWQLHHEELFWTRINLEIKMLRLHKLWNKNRQFVYLDLKCNKIKKLSPLCNTWSYVNNQVVGGVLYYHFGPREHKMKDKTIIKVSVRSSLRLEISVHYYQPKSTMMRFDEKYWFENWKFSWIKFLALNFVDINENQIPDSKDMNDETNRI